jgi:hypothetical protein
MTNWQPGDRPASENPGFIITEIDVANLALNEKGLGLVRTGIKGALRKIAIAVTTVLGTMALGGFTKTAMNVRRALAAEGPLPEKDPFTLERRPLSDPCAARGITCFQDAPW